MLVDEPPGLSGVLPPMTPLSLPLSLVLKSVHLNKFYRHSSYLKGHSTNFTGQFSHHEEHSYVSFYL